MWISISDKRQRYEVQCSPKKPEPPKDVRELASWFQEHSRKNRLSYDWEAASPTCSLRGKERDALLGWLRGERAKPTAQ
ncbi:MAG: hypothetical protein QM723_23480 [Myxococcaceae bacterium]